MLKLFLSLMIILFSLLMLSLNHPLSMGIMILTQTLLTCLVSGMTIKTYWFSYILFLTFLGGLLVLFIYVSSIASNEMFSNYFIMNVSFFLLLSLIFLISMFFMNNLMWMNFNTYNMEMNNMFNMLLFFNDENKINLSKLYNNQTFMIMTMLIIYLFITLIAIVKITNIFYGPLRSTLN